LTASIALGELAHAFIEKKECSKEEKTLGQSWEIARISYSAFMPDSSAFAAPLTTLTCSENASNQASE